MSALCPICKRAEMVHAHRPFCSKTCREIDLARWLNEDYSIPAIDPPDNSPPTKTEIDETEDEIN